MLKAPVMLTELLTKVDAHKGTWGNTELKWNAASNSYKIIQHDSELAWDVNLYLWATYDPGNDFIYPNVKGWDDVLSKAIDNNSYNNLNKDEVLSILFGLHHRTRIIDGLWTSMFERGIIQNLLRRLQTLASE